MKSFILGWKEDKIGNWSGREEWPYNTSSTIHPYSNLPETILWKKAHRFYLLINAFTWILFSAFSSFPFLSMHLQVYISIFIKTQSRRTFVFLAEKQFSWLGKQTAFFCAYYFNVTQGMAWNKTFISMFFFFFLSQEV